MNIRARKSGLGLCANGSNFILNNNTMKRLQPGTKIIDEDRTFPEYGTIVYHVDSLRSEDLYLIRWAGGVRTLFEVKKENLVN